ncbi:MAG: glycosyltransferase, partial [Pseudomonadota bacterium]
MLSVIIPANNEAGYIEPCLDALLAQDPAPPVPVEIIIAANACTDDTVAIARSYAARAEARGWRLEVLDIAEGG